jgi:cell division protein FtsB
VRRANAASMAELAPRVRWDRIGRIALLFVGLLLIYLYINPMRTYLSTWQEAKTKRAEVAALQREHDALVRRQRALRRRGSIDIEARRLGMVRRDERAYVVRGLPRGK